MKILIFVFFFTFSFLGLFAQNDSISVQELDQMFNQDIPKDRTSLSFPLPDLTGTIIYVFPDTIMSILKELVKEYDDSYEKKILLFSEGSKYIIKFIAYPNPTLKNSNKKSLLSSNRVCIIDKDEIQIYLESDLEFSFLSRVIFKGYIYSIEFHKISIIEYEVNRVYLDIVYD